MDEEHDAEAEQPVNHDGDEFVENATKCMESNDDDPTNDDANPSHSHGKWLWLHAAFHCLVTMVVSATYNTS